MVDEKLKLGVQKIYRDYLKGNQGILAVCCWDSKRCSLRTFDPEDKNNFIVLDDEDRKKLIEQLQMVDKGKGEDGK